MAAGRGEVNHYMMKSKDPILDLILLKYRQASRDTIRGPVAIKADLNIFHKTATVKRFNIPEIPEEFKLKQTNFDGNNLSCFSIGGEKKLAFTELVRTVLKEINTHDIFKKRDMLLIFTSKCTQKQLDQLKYVGVLPWTSTSSNLISKSDAYRLCGALQGHLAFINDNVKYSPLSFQVYHECFGGCIGTFDPDCYTEPNAACIKCVECKRMFPPSKFVSHNHTSYDEVHTCHWGFDSSRWRIYLMLVEEKACSDLLTVWNNIKTKFTGRHIYDDNDMDQNQDAEFVAYINSPDNKKAMVSPIETLRSQEESLLRPDQKDSSAFGPWSPKPSHHISRQSVYKQMQSDLYRYPMNVECRTLPGAVSTGNLNAQHTHCECLPSSPAYTDCSQCRTAAQNRCNSNLQVLAQKASERTPECSYTFSKHQAPGKCLCNQCVSIERESQSKNALESSVEDIINNFTSEDMKLKTSAKDLAKLLSSAIKQLHISQDEKVREIAMSNQRLQTELNLFKLESQKKLSEARDTNAHVEHELETLHRERQKELNYLNHMRWELGCQKQLEQYGDKGKQHENKDMKSHIDYRIGHPSGWRPTLRKPLSDSWTPFPTMARKFSDSEDSDSQQQYSSGSKGKLISHHVSVLSKSDGEGSDVSQPLSPASKSRKLDEKCKQQEDDSTSEIEVED